MKEKINQMFKDKLFLVMLVLGLLTMVAAAGVITIQRENGQKETPYLDMQGQEPFLAEKEEQETSLAGVSDAEEELPVREETEQYAADTEFTEEEAAQAGINTAAALVLDFSETSRLAWPHRGNIVLDYSMDSTIYFPTLEQYKCNSGLVIQADISEPVFAPANARVLKTGVNEEIGNFVVLDLGNEYSAVCGQLKEIPVCEGEYLEKGQLLGYVAEPTKYYTVEGSNVYFQMKYQNHAVDPLDYLE